MFKSIFSKNQIDTLNACYNSKTNQLSLYGEFVALLSDGNDLQPSINVIYNNLGKIVTFSRVSSGAYNLTTTDNFFEEFKTVFSITNNQQPGVTYVIGRLDGNTIRISTYFNGVISDDLLWRTPVTIRVYK